MSTPRKREHEESGSDENEAKRIKIDHESSGDEIEMQNPGSGDEHSNSSMEYSGEEMSLGEKTIKKALHTTGTTLSTTTKILIPTMIMQVLLDSGLLGKECCPDSQVRMLDQECGPDNH